MYLPSTAVCLSTPSSGQIQLRCTPLLLTELNVSIDIFLLKAAVVKCSAVAECVEGTRNWHAGFSQSFFSQIVTSSYHYKVTDSLSHQLLRPLHLVLTHLFTDLLPLMVT